MATGLSNVVGIHAGETAWVFGKGPSLSSFPLEKAGKIRCAVNETAAYIPDCKYVFANDGVRGYRDVFKPGMRLFQPRRALCEFDSGKKGELPCDVVIFDDDYGDDRLFLPPSSLAECLAIRRGTLGSAIQILSIMGVRSIILVGFDGGEGRAEGFPWRTRLRSDHANEYRAIRESAIEQGELMGIDLQFYNQDKTMTEGKTYIRMTRSCFVDSVPRSNGEIWKALPSRARELIARGWAVPHEAPAESPKQPASTEKQPAKDAPKQKSKP